MLFITATYPFSGEEDTFIPQEIPYLVHEFSIVVAPIRANSKKLLEIPPSVKLETTLLFFTKMNFKNLVDYFRILFDPSVARDLLREIFQKFNFGFIMEAILTLHRSVVLASKILEMNQIHKFNLIYSWWSDTSALASVLAARKLQIPSISRAHGFDLYSNRHRYRKIPYQNFIIKKSQGIFPDSNRGTEHLINTKFGTKEKIQCSFLGIPFHSGIAKNSEGNVVRLISVSSVVPVKRLDLLLSSLKHIREKFPDFQFYWTHIGGGTGLPELMSTANSTGSLNGFFRFTGHIPTHENLLNFYLAEPVDLFINLSESEGTPVAALEAASFGVTILATDVGGNSELVEKTRGVLLPSNPSKEQIADSILRFRKQSPNTIKNLFFKSDYVADVCYSDFNEKIWRVLNSELQKNSNN